MDVIWSSRSALVLDRLGNSMQQLQNQLADLQGIVDEKILEGGDGGGVKAAGPGAPETKVFDFWGVANALADSVKKTTADISAR